VKGLLRLCGLSYRDELQIVLSTIQTLDRCKTCPIPNCNFAIGY